MLTLCDAAETRSLFDRSEAEMLHEIRKQELILRDEEMKLQIEKTKLLQEQTRRELESLKAKRQNDSISSISIDQLVDSVIDTRVNHQWEEGIYEGRVVDAYYLVHYDDGDKQWETKLQTTESDKCCRSTTCTKHNKHQGRCNNTQSTKTATYKLKRKKITITEQSEETRYSKRSKSSPSFFGVGDGLFDTVSREWKSE